MAEATIHRRSVLLADRIFAARRGRFRPRDAMEILEETVLPAEGLGDARVVARLDEHAMEIPRVTDVRRVEGHPQNDRRSPRADVTEPRRLQGRLPRPDDGVP